MKIQALDLNSDPISDSAPGFWRRQFQQERTRKQTQFDWAFGVVIPTLCVAADPAIFKGGIFNGPYLGSFRPFAYLLSFTSIMAMVAWLCWRERLKSLAAPVAGLFLLGGGVCLVVGVVMFPLSLLGLFVLIGALGFTPFVSSVIYLRNGVRAYRTAGPFLDDRTRWGAAFLAGVFAFVTPYVANKEISNSMSLIVKGNASIIQREAAKLRFVAPLVDPTPASYRYHNGDPREDKAELEELAKFYKNVSGEDIENGRRNW